MNQKWYKSQSFYGALFIAIFLWIYTTLNQENSANVSVPFDLILPENRALKSDIPDKIEVNILGSGWNLFSALNFGSGIKSTLDLSNRPLTDRTDKISKNDLLGSLINLGTFEARTILTDEFEIEFGKIIEKKVPIISNYSFDVSDGFDISSEPKLAPDSVIIKGNEDVVKSINSWETKSYNFKKIKDDLFTSIELSDSLNNILELSINSIDLYAEVEPISTITIPDMSVKVKNGDLPRNLEIYPNIISVVLSGNSNLITNIKKSDVEVFVDYNEIRNTKTMVIEPFLETKNKKIKILDYSPKILYLTENKTDD